MVPRIDPDVSRRKPAIILRGSAAVAVVSIRGALISSLPNILLPAVRLSIRDLAFSGMKSWERTPLSVVVSRVESIVDVVAYAVIEMYI